MRNLKAERRQRHQNMGCGFAAAMPWEPVEDLEHASRLFIGIATTGGEGLILRRPDARYSTRRTNDVLKLKRCPLSGAMEWKERRRGEMRVV